jgi:ribosomal protein L37AE/L43A
LEILQGASVSWEPGKPSQNEDEYFARRDAEWLRERRAALDAERAAQTAATKLMQCPRCDGRLHERRIKTLTVDVCDKCRGVWLDAGELDMVVHLKRGELLRAVHEIDAGKGAR